MVTYFCFYVAALRRRRKVGQHALSYDDDFLEAFHDVLDPVGPSTSGGDVSLQDMPGRAVGVIPFVLSYELWILR